MPSRVYQELVSEKTLIWVLALEIVPLACAIGVIFGHVAWIWWNKKRSRPVLARARTILVAALGESAPSSDDMSFLIAMPVRLQARLFSNLAPSVGGSHQEQLSAIAEKMGLVVYGEALCKSRWWWKRLYGIRLLTTLGAGDISTQSLFNDWSPWVRAQIAEWAVDHPKPDVIDGLLTQLDDPAGVCRFAAQDSLLRMGNIVIEPLAEYIATGSGRKLETAMEVAVSLADPRLLNAALARCHDDVPQVRALAASILGTLGGEEAVNRLAEMLFDITPTVRAASAQSLGSLAHWPAAAKVAPLLADPEWAVRKEAGLALKLFEAPGILFLRRALSSSNSEEADMAQQVLALSGVTEPAFTL